MAKIPHFILKIVPFLIPAVIVFLSLDKSSEAGDYHTGNTLICSQCHSMHFSQSHGYVSGVGVHPRIGSTGPYPYLLRKDFNELCLSCHDNLSTSGNPDVLGARSTATIRQGGMLTTGTAPYENWKGHTLGSTATAPGGTFNNPNGFKCIDCHTSHGEVPSQYRNLWTSTDSGNKFYNKPVTYVTGTSNDTSKDVWQRTASKFTGSGTGCLECHQMMGVGNRYDITDITFNEPDQTKSAYGAWCKSCHTNIHGSGGDSNMGGQSGGDAGTPWKRHPTADVNIGANSNAHSSYAKWSTGWTNTKRVQTLSNSGNYPNQDNTPSCMSCHKAHGSVNAFGLIYTNSDGTLAIESTGTGASLPNTCRQCHSQ